MRSHAHRDSNSGNTAVVHTAGESLSGDRFLELVKHADSTCGIALLCPGKGTKVHRSLQIDGQVFEPFPATASEVAATRIPAVPGPSARNPQELFSLISSAIANTLPLAKAQNDRLTLFCISSWLSDALPMAPPLLITGPDPLEGLCALRVLHALCRRPIILSGGNATRLGSLSTLFHTLLFFRPELGPKCLANQLQSSNHAGVYSPAPDGVRLLCRPKAVFVVDGAGREEFFNGECLRVVLDGSSPYSSLKSQRIEAIANELQSQLLAYRVARWNKVHDADIPTPNYHPAVKNIAAALAACAAGNHKLKDHIISILADDNMDARGRESTDPRVAVVESLLACVHAGEQEILVRDLATKVNVLIRARGDLREYSAMEIGWKLRDLSLIPRRRAAGRVLLFDSDMIRRIHDLGRSVGVMDFHSPKKSCTWCKPIKAVDVMEVM